jgi:hypothetical protein
LAFASRYCENPTMARRVNPVSHQFCVAVVMSGELNNESPMSAMTGAMTTGERNRRSRASAATMMAPWSCTSAARHASIPAGGFAVTTPTIASAGASIEKGAPWTIGYRLPTVVCASVAIPDTTKKVPTNRGTIASGIPSAAARMSGTAMLAPTIVR